MQQGHSESKAIEMAKGIVANWAEGHDGKGGKVSAEVQAAAAKNIAQWEAKRAKAKAIPNKGREAAFLEGYKMAFPTKKKKPPFGKKGASDSDEKDKKSSSSSSSEKKMPPKGMPQKGMMSNSGGSSSKSEDSQKKPPPKKNSSSNNSSSNGDSKKKPPPNSSAGTSSSGSGSTSGSTSSSSSGSSSSNGKSDGKKPYGDVTYADPGYQQDGKKRYPLDTPDHIKAAWSYINMPKNAKAYSSSQLATIKNKIKAAMKSKGSKVSSEAEILNATHGSRVIEAKDNDETTGGRIFGIKVIDYKNPSKNGRRYPESVMRNAAGMYNGAKVYDHHRTDAELRSSTIHGVVGYLNNVAPQDDGLYADLYLFPSATHAAEALDASLELQTEGHQPLVGISHDVLARFKRVQEGGRSIQEATSIEAVQSADIVAQPAAGGHAVRAIAGGEEDEEDEQDTEDLVMPLDEAAINDLVNQAVAAKLTEFGVDPTSLTDTDDVAATDNVEEVEIDTTQDEEVDAAQPELVGAATESVRTTESDDDDVEYYTRNKWYTDLMIERKLNSAKMPKSAREAVIRALPERFTEADVDAQISAGKDWISRVERDNLKPTATGKVVQESLDKKKEALDAFFAGDFTKYHSFRQAYMDFTGNYPRNYTEDFARTILQESSGNYHSVQGERATESMDSTTWNLVLGDSITRKMVAEYNQPGLKDWEAIVSSRVPVNDFRTQRIDRIGGYDLLPAVAQGAPYQPLVSPDDEEVTYAISKRGGTEDITLEMIANDDVRSISRIPTKLGLSASLTLHRFVWDFLVGSANIYDGNALFTAGHANLKGSAGYLSQSTLSLARAAMRKQKSYGDSNNILSLVPKTLIVPTSLEEVAFQLTKSAVAVPGSASTVATQANNATAAASDTPNIHTGMQLIVLDHITDAGNSSTFWYLVADTGFCPTVEVGFYQGRDVPELFTQSDNSVGSMFDADKLTYKIRHIYSGAVLDYRGFYATPVA